MQVIRHGFLLISLALLFTFSSLAILPHSIHQQNIAYQWANKSGQVFENLSPAQFA